MNKKIKLCTHNQYFHVKMFTEVYILLYDTPSDGFVQTNSLLTSSMSAAPMLLKCPFNTT